MFELSDQYQRGARIKVVGIGGGGGNAIQHMIDSGIDNVDFVAANTDSQALERLTASTIIQLGESMTKGLGAGANPEMGRQAAEEDRERIEGIYEGTDMLFLTAGMGGGTGTGAAPVFAEVARQMGILTVAVVTRPFAFEGNKRQQVAEAGIDALSKMVDSLIVVPNDKLLAVLGKSVSLLEAFRKANDVLLGAVRGISDLITRPGLINVDYADVKTVMSEKGTAMMGSGAATGENRAEEAAQAAISSPLLEDIDMTGARGVLVNLTAGIDMSIGEFEVVGAAVKALTSDDATVVVGTVIDPEMEGELRVTVVVTGLGQEVRTEVIEPSLSTLLSTQKVAEEPALQSKAPVIQAAKPLIENDLDTPAFLRRQQSYVPSYRPQIVTSEPTQAPIGSAPSEPAPSQHQANTSNESAKSESAVRYEEKPPVDFLDIPAFLRQEEDVDA